MSEAKHTPGPWEAKNTGRHWNNEEIDNWIITYGKDDEQIVDHCYEEADARLIAAAPDLLAACESFVGAYPMGINKDLDEAYRAARAAIHKVKGGDQ